MNSYHDILQQSVPQLIRALGRMQVEDALSAIAGHFPGKAVLTDSFSLEDQLIRGIIERHHLPIRIHIWDTEIIHTGSLLLDLTEAEQAYSSSGHEALQGRLFWIRGHRAAQDSSLPLMRWNAAHHMVEYHPFSNWTDEELRDYIRRHPLPSMPSLSRMPHRN
jgi:3'-phosphoadenosine 5'-phosphosulfate sulfotransferase (PAPS reductase)/FAD synthetase